MSLRGAKRRGNLLVPVIELHNRIKPGTGRLPRPYGTRNDIIRKRILFVMRYYVYILTNKYCTVLYTGVTRDLVRRVYEHKNHLDKDSFTSKYNVTKLVYFEETSDVRAAIEREKQIKSWSRERKTSLIMEKNPNWTDLYPRILG